MFFCSADVAHLSFCKLSVNRRNDCVVTEKSNNFIVVADNEMAFSTDTLL